MLTLSSVHYSPSVPLLATTPPQSLRLLRAFRGAFSILPFRRTTSREHIRSQERCNSQIVLEKRRGKHLYNPIRRDAVGFPRMHRKPCICRAVSSRPKSRPASVYSQRDERGRLQWTVSPAMTLSNHGSSHKSRSATNPVSSRWSQDELAHQDCI
jgi:hypothetical protein